MNLGSNDPEREKIFTRRTFLFSGGMTALFGGITYRLAQLQLVEHDHYDELARENQFNRRVITPLRGEIVDRFGKIIASNRKNFRVLLIPEQSRDVSETLDQINQLIEITPEKRARILRQIQRMGRFTPVEIADNLDWDTFSKINFEVPHLPGILPEEGRTRDYPLGNGTAFVIGYVGAPNEKDVSEPTLAPQERTLLRQPGFKVGREGLEKRYDNELRGKAGEKLVKVNAHGRVIAEIDEGMTPPVQGERLALTIDSQLQMAAMEALGEESGSAVVVDVKTGEILVLASTPAFDPNNFNVGIDPALWRSLNADPNKPLVNKPLSGAYPPASTFKLISAIAAQESGISSNFGVRCRGQITYGGNTHRCWKRGGHGYMDMKNAIKHSCDVFFYEIAKRLEIDLLADVARRFGLGQVFEIGIPGQKKGVIPDRAWKRDYFAGNPDNQQWFGGETLSVIIGQGYVTSTPLQLAIMTARLATGRSVRPTLVRGVGETLVPIAQNAPVSVDPKHLDVVRSGMSAVVNEVGGTARRAALDKEIGAQLAGKTGTGQVASLQRDPKTGRILKNDELPRHLRDHALFVSYAPLDDPRYACSVVVEHGQSGSRTASPIAKKIMDAVMRRDPALKQPYDPRIVARIKNGTQDA